MTSHASAVLLTAAVAGLVAPVAAGQRTGCGIAPEPIVCEMVPNPDERPVIQLAICLDTSGSMNGLLQQARTRIWSIVNELAGLRRRGFAPRLEIAIYQYGSDHHPASENFTACVLPFTTDLDAISEALFSLTIAGSNEYCGAAIRSAGQQLEWTASGDGAMRLLVIAGNEPFTQGPVDYRSAIADAVERGIVVSTIYCGRDEEGQASGWLHAAHLAGGDYSVIEQDRELIHIPCPQDEPLRRLNARLNETYLHYGTSGLELSQRQRRMDDANAAAALAAMLDRIAAKSSIGYRNASWDLVDRYETEGRDGLADVDRSTLPDRVAHLSDDELAAEIARLADERTVIRAEIQRLSDERQRHLESERRKAGSGDGRTLDDALLRSIRERAAEFGLEDANAGSK